MIKVAIDGLNVDQMSSLDAFSFNIWPNYCLRQQKVLAVLSADESMTIVLENFRQDQTEA